jgi:hypothetical protein
VLNVLCMSPLKLFVLPAESTQTSVNSAYGNLSNGVAQSVLILTDRLLKYKCQLAICVCTDGERVYEARGELRDGYADGENIRLKHAER